MVQGEQKIIAQNKRAGYDYEIIETIEAGLALKGTEIKSIRSNRVNLKGGFAQVQNGEVWLKNVHVSPYEEGNIWNLDPDRIRKLLLHKRQIQNLEKRVNEEGTTLIPLKVYIKDGFAKLLLGLVKGKTNYDKREAIRSREQNRCLTRYMKRYNRR